MASTSSKWSAAVSKELEEKKWQVMIVKELHELGSHSANEVNDSVLHDTAEYGGLDNDNP